MRNFPGLEFRLISFAADEEAPKQFFDLVPDLFEENEDYNQIYKLNNFSKVKNSGKD